MKLSDLIRLLPDSSLHRVSSPLLLSRAFDMTFGPQDIGTAQLKVSKHFAYPVNSKFPLRQIIYLTSTITKDPTRLSGGGLVWSKRVGTRSSSKYVAIPWMDAMIPIDRTADFASTAVGRLATIQEYELESLVVSRHVLGILKKAAIDVSSR